MRVGCCRAPSEQHASGNDSARTPFMINAYAFADELPRTLQRNVVSRGRAAALCIPASLVSGPARNVCLSASIAASRIAETQ
eukprot:CAMPEP_0173115870 /NCGR_PEP_ID=MMETSP1102-20130122/48848_1 /TAXON_ID=49646 /ORGANISM="Geminigera sp., Strain Caron Lab Isolate" /LENGTH=81 /DNA_ID=CAMNT_0014019169 /DNA_START=35 /DNA_END=277 /DNA_ORIENTATION=-